MMALRADNSGKAGGKAGGKVGIHHPMATIAEPSVKSLLLSLESAGQTLGTGTGFTLSVYGHVVPGLQEQSTRAMEARLLGENTGGS